MRTFVEELEVSGFATDTLQRSNQPNAAVAPAEEVGSTSPQL
jgi:hypothetical protein